MAKAKKSDTADKKTAPAKAPAKKPAAQGKAKSGSPAGSASTPMIDTNLAAQSAARMLTAGRQNKPAAAAGAKPAAGPESSMFKQLKQGLSRSHLSGMADVLEKSALPGNKKPNLPGGRNEQVGRNQTFGADVNRAGVPRRTPG